ncbi:unnamed protein product, partial [marine sediment metagenome]
MTERGEGNIILERHTLLKGEVVSEFKSALEDFKERRINSYGLLGQVALAWRAANENHALKQKIEQEMRKRRRFLEAVLDTHIDPSKHQDRI